MAPTPGLSPAVPPPAPSEDLSDRARAAGAARDVRPKAPEASAAPASRAPPPAAVAGNLLDGQNQGVSMLTGPSLLLMQKTTANELREDDADASLEAATKCREEDDPEEENEDPADSFNDAVSTVLRARGEACPHVRRP